MNSYALTDVGKMRVENQDSIFASDDKIGALPNLYIVADGMGGENAGDYASKRCIEVIVDEVKKSKSSKLVEILNQAIQNANNLIFHESKIDEAKKGMGTTVVLATIIDNHLWVANVGDSRLYVSGRNKITQITKDHSVVAELVRNGELEASAAKTDGRKNMITRAVGAESSLAVDFFDVTLTGDEKILLCSDGLTNMVDDDEILNILNEAKGIESMTIELVDTANANGGKDNISTIVIEIG